MKFGLFPEGLYQCGASAHPSQGSASGAGQLGEVFWTQIGQFMLLAVAPDVFNRIELRSVSRQVVQVDLATQVGNKLPHQAAAMNRQPVPDDQELGTDVPLQVFQKLDDLRGFNASRKQPEIKAPDGNSGHGRKAFPVERILQHGSLAPGSPRANPVGSLAQTAFVHKHYSAPLLLGFFFNSGQRTRFQRLMADSLRWLARPVGLWQLQPKSRKIRHTCPG